MSDRAYRRWLTGAAGLFVVLSAAALCLTSKAAFGQETRRITDMSGAEVVLPARIGRIAEQFPAHTITDIMLGAGDRLVAIPQNVKTIPLLRAIYPRIASVAEPFRGGGVVNIEDLLLCQPDVVSATGRGSALSPYQSAHLPAVSFTFNSFEQLGRSITLAGEVYGGTAPAQAAAYVKYLDARLQLIRTRLAGLSAGARPTLVHISSFPPLVVDGGDSIMDQWITLAGAANAAREISGAHASVTLEQLLRWDPEVLIVQTPGGDQGLVAGTGRSVIAALSRTEGWQQLKAVRSGRVYINPQGMYPWERASPEEALQIQWAAKMLHPQLFQDIDIRAEARRFYLTFFHYTLSEAQLDQMLESGA